MKAQASRNAREAFRVERARTQLFDAATGIEAAGDTDRRNGDFDQPAIFQGTLKGYQLKGMNWLANLYDQVLPVFRKDFNVSLPQAAMVWPVDRDVSIRYLL